MTEIKIEKKRTFWPWLVLSLALLSLAAYLLWFRSDNTQTEADNAFALISVRENNTTVADFVQFVNQDSARMTLDHNYTNQSILKLCNAIGAMAGEIDFEVKADMAKVKEHADTITHDPTETTHADQIRKAADILGNSLQRMQQSKYPELSTEGEQLNRAAAAINPDVLTLQQKDAVKGFFKEAAVLLERMN